MATLSLQSNFEITSYISSCFEQLCRHYVQHQANSFNCLKVGRQWAANYEIDVAGINADFKLNVVGECKWSHKKAGMSIYHKLRAQVEEQKLPVSPQCKYILFSRSGFTDEIKRQEIHNDNLILVESIFKKI